MILGYINNIDLNRVDILSSKDFTVLFEESSVKRDVQTLPIPSPLHIDVPGQTSTLFKHAEAFTVPSLRR